MGMKFGQTKKKQVRRYPRGNKPRTIKIKYPVNLFIKVGGRWLPPIEVKNGKELREQIEWHKILNGNVTDYKTEKIKQ